MASDSQLSMYAWCNTFWNLNFFVNVSYTTFKHAHTHRHTPHSREIQENISDVGNTEDSFLVIMFFWKEDIYNALKLKCVSVLEWKKYL